MININESTTLNLYNPQNFWDYKMVYFVINAENESKGGCGKYWCSCWNLWKRWKSCASSKILWYLVLKGLSAYREHLNILNQNLQKIDDVIGETLYFTLTNVNFNFNDLSIN